MDALTLFLTETILISLAIILLHHFKTYFGIGLLLIFLGSVQFIQTILTTTVYNKIFDKVIVSPGSAILYTSTLCCLLLVFHTEGVKKNKNCNFWIIIFKCFISSCIGYYCKTASNRHLLYSE